jgi:hypothetical protein
MKVVDEVCREIESNETAINVPCLCPGLLQVYTSKSDDVEVGWLTTNFQKHQKTFTLPWHSPTTPHLLRSQPPAHPAERYLPPESDIQGWKVPMRALNSHASSSPSPRKPLATKLPT